MVCIGGLLGAVAALAVDRWGSDGSARSSAKAVVHVRHALRPAPASPAVAPVRRTHSVRPDLASVRGKTIVLDPGHNGGNWRHPAEVNRLVNAGTLMKPCDTVGAATLGGYPEATYTLDVATRLARLLRRAGARVVLTRTASTPWGPCITERAAIGNRAHAAVAISIHADGGPVSGRGFHVIYPPSIPGLTDDIAASSHRLALDVRDAYAAGTRMPYSTYAGRDALDVRSDLGGLNLSDVPKVFIETANMRNATDASLLVQPSFRERVARALAEGLARFLAGR
jgi:N-acetylmuramoyl-L-alanine amidase